MQIENEFEVAAPPDKVFAFLLDVNSVVACMPGAELSETVDAETFKGRVKIKVGPITVAYNGTAKITEKDDAARRAKLEASGRETTGPGSAQATAVMTVSESGAGSRVHLATDYTVAGRVANFGRGVMEDVSRRLVAQMADCIKSRLEAPAAAAPTEVAGGGGFQPPASVTPGTGAGDAAQVGPAPAPAPSAPPASPPAPAKPVNALALMWAVFWDRLKRLFTGK